MTNQSMEIEIVENAKKAGYKRFLDKNGNRMSLKIFSLIADDICKQFENIGLTVYDLKSPKITRWFETRGHKGQEHLYTMELDTNNKKQKFTYYDDSGYIFEMPIDRSQITQMLWEKYRNKEENDIEILLNCKVEKFN